MAIDSEKTKNPLRDWRGRQGWWKWIAIVVIGVAILPDSDDTKPDGATKTEVKAASAPTTAAAALAPSEVRDDMIERDGHFWTQQSEPVKVALVNRCLRAAKAEGDIYGRAKMYVTKLPENRVAAKLDSFYADKDEDFSGGTNEETKISDQCEEVAQEMAEKRAEQRTQQLERSIEPKNFRATPQRVRRYFALQSRQRDLRSVSCTGRSTCNVALNSTVGDLGFIAKFLPGDAEAYSKDFVLQLATDITPVFQRLFGDNEFERGTVSAWLEVVDVGGKEKRVPAMTVTCDRAADKKIDWDNVGAEGLATYCQYDLRPISGVSAP